MTINKKTTEKLLELARMEISEKEKEKLTKDLNGILEYINQLKEIDTDNIGLDLEKSGDSLLREDEIWPKDSLEHDLLISGFRERENNKLKVPGILEK